MIDEAYFDYLDPDDRLDAIADSCVRATTCSRLRTFSKLYGLAGLRVGYGVGPAAVDRGDPEGPARLRRGRARPGCSARKPRGLGRGRATTGREPRRPLPSSRRCSGTMVSSRSRAASTNFVLVDVGADADELAAALLAAGVACSRGRRSAHRPRCASAQAPPADLALLDAALARQVAGVAQVQRELTPCKPRGKRPGPPLSWPTGARRPFPYEDDTQERRRTGPLRQRQRQDAVAAGADCARHDLPPARAAAPQPVARSH